MSKVTKCDVCGLIGEEMKKNRWVEIRVTKGLFERFSVKPRRKETCKKCLDRLKALTKEK